MRRDARDEMSCALDVLEPGLTSLRLREKSRPLDALILGQIEREPEASLHGRRGWEAANDGIELAKCRLLRLTRQLGKQAASARELGGQLPSLDGFVYLAEPPAQV